MSFRSLQPHMVYRRLLKCSFIHFSMWICLHIIRVNEWISSERHCCLFAETLYFRKLILILILFTFDLCFAYEATRANRKLLTVYIAVLNQQLCKMKQKGKYSRMTRQNLLAVRVTWTVWSVNFKSVWCHQVDWGHAFVTECAVKCMLMVVCVCQNVGHAVLLIKLWQWAWAGEGRGGGVVFRLSYVCVRSCSTHVCTCEYVRVRFCLCAWMSMRRQ